MKLLLSTIVISFFILSSSFQCGKEGIPQILPETGKWELREIRGDMPVTPYQPGNGNIVKFIEGKYEMFRNNTIDKSGTYRIEWDETVQKHICLTNLESTFRHRIIFDNNREQQKTFIGYNKRGDTLMLASGCFASDGGSISKYVKIP